MRKALAPRRRCVACSARLEEEDDLIDRLIETNPKFREMLRRSLNSKTISLEEAKRRL